MLNQSDFLRDLTVTKQTEMATTFPAADTTHDTATFEAGDHIQVVFYTIANVSDAAQSVELSFTESDDNSTFTQVADRHLSGRAKTVNATNTTSTYTSVAYTGLKQYVRGRLVVKNSTSTAIVHKVVGGLMGVKAVVPPRGENG